ncbi:MAG: hypothetical protein IT442_13135 [Phycisphaeraceae bacterium]|nr:hypothetical protein [Phycisphaeraceae bacterium]
MTAVLAYTLWLLGLVVLWKMIGQYRRGEHDLLSMRNIYLVGFVLFQLSSAAVSLLTGNYMSLYIDDPVLTGLQYIAMASLFLVLMFWAYRRGWVAVKLADRMPRTDVVPGSLLLIVLAVMMTVLAMILKFSVKIPLIAIIASDVGLGASSVACGLVGWVWARRFFNPVMVLIALAVVLPNLATAVSGSAGRRGMTGLFLTMGWGMYYSIWRYLPWKLVLRRLAIVSIPGIIFLALFTSVRTFTGDRSLGAYVTSITQVSSLKVGLLDLLRGQDTGPAALWTIENFPDHIPRRHLFTIGYFIVYPVPRGWWLNKPIPLSLQIPELARVYNVPWGKLTTPPGIIGNAQAEGGWYALVIYAILTGLFLRFLDRLVLNSVYSPFVVLPLAAALGQMLALARGEPSAFAFIFIETAAIIWAFMLLFAKFLNWTGLASNAEIAGMDMHHYIDQSDSPEQAPAAGA